MVTRLEAEEDRELEAPGRLEASELSVVAAPRPVGPAIGELVVIARVQQVEEVPGNLELLSVAEAEDLSDRELEFQLDNGTPRKREWPPS